MAGLNIGKIYPGVQSGTATLVAGVATVTFPRAFTMIPNVMCQSLTVGTTLTQVYPASVTAASFTASSVEQLLTGGSLVNTISGTTCVANFNWLAYVEN